ncbi:MAG: phytanoyl-CoA dioxygenase family protein [Paracoccaceae bacterium]
MIKSKQIETYQNDGVVMIPGLFAKHVDALRLAVAENMSTPGPYASRNEKPGQTGLFFDDYCNWQRFQTFEDAARDPEITTAAQKLMASAKVQLFHDHVLVKEPGTSMPTPWHSDGPYYFVGGQQNVSFWVPLDPVTTASLRVVAGSHLWAKDILPTRWVSEDAFFEGDYLPAPDPDKDGMDIREWQMQPGDAVAFHFRSLHGARGNTSTTRRRAFSLRLLGDDATYVERPGPTSPPFPGYGMTPGQELRTDWFPILT